MKKRLISFLRRKINYVAFMLVSIFLVLLKLSEIGKSLKNRIEITSTLDLSWQTDMVERLLAGHIAGRDFIFTYGPLYQLLESFLAIVLGIPSYVSVLYSQIVLISIVGILCFLIARLISINKKDQVLISVLLLFLTVFNSQLLANSLIKFFIPLMYSLLCLKLQTEKFFSLKSLGILVLPSLFGLYSFDIFLLCIAMIGVFILYDLITILINSSSKSAQRKKTKQTLVKGAYLIITIVSFEALVSFVISRNLDYLYYSLDTISNYQFIMNIPLSFNKVYVFFIFPIILLAVLIYGLANRYFDSDLKRKLVFLSIAALLSIKSAITRADEGHILTGIYPSIIVLFLLLYFLSKSSKKVFAVFSLSIFLFAIFVFKQENHPQISIPNINNAIHGIRSEIKFFEIYKLPENYYYTKNDFDYFESLISENPGNVMIYPYDSFILNISNQTYDTLPLQFYQYSNSLVEKKAVQKLTQSSPKFIILGVDTKGAKVLDDIPNMSRNSILTKWMISNYSVYRKNNNYLVLKHNPNKKLSDSPPINCSAYDIDVEDIMKTNLFEKLFKSSTYYLHNNISIRLPYSPDIESVFIFEGYSDPKDIQRLIETKTEFEKYIHQDRKNLEVIRKYPIPVLKKNIEKKFAVKCY